MRKIQFYVFGLFLLLSAAVFAGTGDPVSLPELITVVLGVLAPIIIQLITKEVTNEMARYLISLVLSGVIGFIALLLVGYPITATPEMIIKLFAYASVSYKLFWKPIWNNPKLSGKMAGKPTVYYKNKK